MLTLLDGRWEAVRIGNNPDGTVLNSQQTAVHACLAYNPNDDTWKVLYFRAYNLESGFIKTRMWNPPSSEVATQITSQTIPNWPAPDPPPDPPLPEPRLFCGGHCFMHDGRLFAAGGTVGTGYDPFIGLPYAYTFDPTITDDNSKWRFLNNPVPMPMQDGRWYPTVTRLPNKWLLVMSGFTTQPALNRLPEIWDPDQQVWIRRTQAQAQMPFDTLYPAAHVVPRGEFEGKVFYSTPYRPIGGPLKRQSYVFDPYFDGIPNGQYYWKTVGGQTTVLRDDGCSILLPIKPSPSTEVKVLIFGGREYDPAFNNQVANNTAEIINLADNKPDWVPAPSLTLARNHANAVMLPDGKIFVTGGNQIYYREGAVTSAELFDSEANGGAGSWKLLPPSSYTRMYHSTAILLPDATVWVSGGDTLLGSPSSDYIEIYSPGYLFDGPNNLAVRPSITAISSNQIGYRETFNIETNVPVDMAILISLGATTHAFDQNQRAIILPLESGPPNGVHPYIVSTPENSNIAPPGYYMFFVLRPKSASTSGTNRIPSIAKFLRLE
jgi:hypothetical protein